MAKSAMIAKGKKKYIQKIDALGGATAYIECGKKGGMDTAICMKGLKAKVATTAAWASAWESAMS